MNFENPLISGLFVKRYKRFLVDVSVNNKKRKLKYTLQIIRDRKSKVGVNTHLTNKIVNHALQNNLIKYFSKEVVIKNEQTFGLNSRFDFYLEDKNIKSFLEVKNVTLKRKNKTAEFPDSITSRGKKHLNELINATKKGYKAYLLFVIQRDDCSKFTIAKDIDPEYSRILIKAIKHNVKILCYDCKFSTKGIKLNNEIKFRINE